MLGLLLSLDSEGRLVTKVPAKRSLEKSADSGNSDGPDEGRGKGIHNVQLSYTSPGSNPDLHNIKYAMQSARTTDAKRQVLRFFKYLGKSH